MTETSSTQRTAGLQLRVPWAPVNANASRDTGGTAERQYEVRDARPSRLASIAIEGLRAEGTLVDLDVEPDRAIPARSPVIFTAELEPAGPASLRDMFSMARNFAPATDQPVEATEQMNALLGADETATVPLIGTAGEEIDVVVLVRRGQLLSDFTIDDICDERLCFGVADRLVPAGQEVDLIRYLFAGLANRSLRRRFEREMADKLADLASQTGETGNFKVSGPAVVVRPAVLA